MYATRPNGGNKAMTTPMITFARGRRFRFLTRLMTAQTSKPKKAIHHTNTSCNRRKSTRIISPVLSGTGSSRAVFGPVNDPGRLRHGPAGVESPQPFGPGRAGRSFEHLRVSAG